jgi:microcystin-dependent protein
MTSRCKILLLVTVVFAIAASVPAQAQVEPFLGEIRFVGFNFAPQGWALCNGQLLSIAQNTALFSLLGTQYGGDGQTTFALPDLQGRVAIGAGYGAGLTQRNNGDKGGQEVVALTIAQMPKHTHNLKAASGAANTKAPNGNLLANSSTTPIYSNQTADTTLRSSVIATTGNNQPHENMQPFTTMTCIIALEGIYPSRN